MFNDIEKWQIEQLARNGGFSDRAIAAYIHGKRLDKVTDEEKHAVTGYRIRQRLLLGDWRNGRTVLSQAHMKKAARGKRKRGTRTTYRRKAG